MSCIEINIDQLMKELVMNWRCIGQWLQRQSLHSKRSWILNTIVTLYKWGEETNIPHSKDKQIELLKLRVWEEPLEERGVKDMSIVFSKWNSNPFV